LVQQEKNIMSYNKHMITLVGKVATEPKVIETANSEFAYFSLPIQESWGKGEERKKHTTWYKITANGPFVNVVKNYIHKGSFVVIDGRPVSDKDGNPKTYTAKDGTAKAEFTVNIINIVIAPDGNAPQSEAEKPEVDNFEF
jgi:single-stranded DNA-binding protein